MASGLRSWTPQPAVGTLLSRAGWLPVTKLVPGPSLQDYNSVVAGRGGYAWRRWQPEMSGLGGASTARAWCGTPRLSTRAGYTVSTTWDELGEADQIVSDGDTPWCVGIGRCGHRLAGHRLTEDLMLRRLPRQEARPMGQGRADSTRLVRGRDVADLEQLGGDGLWR